MAGPDYRTKINRLIRAIFQQYGIKILWNYRQFYTSENRRITLFTLQQQLKDERGKEIKIDLIKTYSHIELVLYLRDLWFELNGWEIPNDNEKWNKKRKEVTHVRL